MIINYIKIALRNFRRNPIYVLVNIAGLATGMTFMLLLMLYVKNELSFDEFHENKAKLYRLTTTLTDKNGLTKTSGASGQVQGPAFKQAIPQVQDYARFWNVGGFNIIGQQKSLWLNGIFADSSFFRLLTFPVLFGNTYSALNDRKSIVITESTAEKYFGEKNVVGRTLSVEEHKGMEPLIIRAVIKDVPANSSYQFDVALPFQLLETFFKDADWFNPYLTTAILLAPNADKPQVEKKFSAVMQQMAAGELADLEKSRGIKNISFSLQPINDVHLSSAENGLSGDVYYGNSYLTIYILSGIAIFLLVMACINFVNLTIAYSLKRAREVGIRKINGGTRTEIILQFLTEAAMLCLAAFALAAAFTKLLLPVFNSLTGRQLVFDINGMGNIWLLCIALLAISILMAGIYPAYVLSNFRAVSVLYEKLKFRATGLLGKSLVVLQFTIAIGLIAGTLVYYLQMQFIMKRSLGYNPRSVIQVQLPPQRNPDHLVRLLRQDLVSEMSVTHVGGVNYWGDPNTVVVNGRPLEVLMLRADEHYIPALEIPLKEGRNFSPAFTTDSIKSVIVNESFVKAAGWKSPIGQQVTLPGEWEGEAKMNVVGVVKDYHHNSLKKEIRPQIFVMKHYEKLVVKVHEGKIPHVLGVLERTYKKHIADRPFQFTLLDDAVTKEYDQERQWKSIITYASAVSVFICCLGLFGLSGIMARQRSREISIRKILGASVAGLAAFLSKDFLKLVIVAFFIATPVSWIFSQRWLMNFAYRIDLNWWVFLAGGLIATLIAMATISFHTLKAAFDNPAKSLRADQ